MTEGADEEKVWSDSGPGPGCAIRCGMHPLVRAGRQGPRLPFVRDRRPNRQCCAFGGRAMIGMITPTRAMMPMTVKPSV